jgi:hypothetical protein
MGISNAYNLISGKSKPKESEYETPVNFIPARKISLEKPHERSSIILH